MLRNLLSDRARAERALSRLTPRERRVLLDRLALMHYQWVDGDYDPHSDFAFSTVQGGSTIIGNPGSPVTIILGTGDGAAFPGGDGTTQFNVLVWPSGQSALVSNAEWVRVTRSGDTLTTTGRGQDGTTALGTIAAGYRVANAVGKRWFTDLESGLKPLYVGMISGHFAFNPSANNDCYLVPFTLAASGTVSAITVNIGTVSGNIDVGIIDAGGNRKTHTGAIASPGIGVQVLSITPLLLAAGAYYGAFSAASTVHKWVGGEADSVISQAARRVVAAHPIPASVTIGTTRPTTGVPSFLCEVA